MKPVMRAGLCLIAALVLTAPAHAQSGGTWSVAGKMTTTRSDIGIAEYGGKIYIMGGNSAGRVDSQMAQEFDPATGKWRDLAPLPRGGSHVGVSAMNGKIYVAGGFLANVHKDPIDQLAEYDIASNSWKVLPPLPHPLGSPGLAAVGGKLHVIGGRGPDAKTVTSHMVLDLATGKWSDAAPLPLARDHLGTVVLGGKIYIVGGRTEATVNNVGQTDVYDPATNAWTTLAPMPTGRSSGFVGTYKGLIVFVGGECKNPQTRMAFDENEAYDPKTNRWTMLQKPMSGMHAGGLASVGDTAYFFGGNGGCGGDNPSTNIYAFKLP
jgi:N-acetylneuraminic acid mutarotase